MPQNIPVLITGGMPDYLLDNIKTSGFDFKHIENPTDSELSMAEVIVGFVPVSRLSEATNLKWLQLPWSGADGYADDPDFPENVILTNATGAFGRPIAEYAFAAVFSLMRRFHLYRDNQRDGIWHRMGDETTPTGKHVLIVGAGDIGTNTAKLFKKFDCTITGVRRVMRDIPPEFDEMITLDEAEAVLPKADIIISCLPSTPLTKGYFCKERLSRLKPSSIFVNVGRGNVVDHTALAQLLENGKIYGAALDVTDPEPLPSDHPLWKCKNAIITPHISGQTFQGLKDKENFFFSLCKENLELYKSGKPLKNIVDLSTGYRRTAN